MTTAAPVVIILEDDSDIAGLLAQLISSYGATPMVCEDQAAVFRAAAGSAVGLAILDIMLPGADGRNVASGLREKGHKFPIYFMTGVRERDIGEEYRALADGILRKPFSFPELRAFLDNALQRREEDGPEPDAKQTLLELMAAVASEQENIRRQQAQLMGLIGSLESQLQEESQAISEQFTAFFMGLESSLTRFSSRLETIREILDTSRSAPDG